MSEQEFKLRDYQNDAVNGIIKSLDSEDSTMMVLPTGMGKTEIFVQVAKHEMFRRVLIICPTTQLVDQTSDKIQQRTEDSVGIEQAGRRCHEEGFYTDRYIVGTKQTLCSPKEGPKRYEKFKDIDLICFDESHLSITGPNLEMAEYFKDQGAKVLGVTATPIRLDGLALDNMYSTVAYTMNVADAINDGWLAPIKARAITINSLDLSAVKVLNRKDGTKEFNTVQLNKELEEDNTIYEYSDVIANETKGKKTIVFCSSIKQAQAISERLVDTHKIKSLWICAKESKISKGKRAEAMERFCSFGEKSVTHIINVGCLTVGFDFPQIEYVVQARPTKSVALATQMLGRGTRPWPGVVDQYDTAEDRRQAIAASPKPYCHVIDLVGACDKCKTITTADILIGDKFDPEVVEAAKKEVLDNEEGVIDFDEIAQNILDANTAQAIKDQVERERRKKIKSEITYTIHQRDVLGSYRTAPPKERIRPSALIGGKKLSEFADSQLKRISQDESAEHKFRYAAASELGKRIDARIYESRKKRRDNFGN